MARYAPLADASPAVNPYVFSAADIVGDFRWSLARNWRHGVTRAAELVFVMLNPSRADAETDDPTIRRCVGFAQREGYDGLVVVNLFPYRSRSPQKLATWVETTPTSIFLPAMTANTQRLCDELRGRDAVLAWGAHGRRFADRVTVVLNIANRFTTRVFTLGAPTQAGQPRHPLYLAADTPLQRLAPKRESSAKPSTAARGAQPVGTERINSVT